MVREGKFTASSNRSGPNRIEAFPGFTLPPLPTDSDPNMLAKRPKSGLAARVLHQVYNAVVNAPDKWEAIFR